MFQTADVQPAGFFGPGSPGGTTPTSYQQTSGFVFDADPRIISNLIVDQTANNPAAYRRSGVERWRGRRSRRLVHDVLKDGVRSSRAPASTGSSAPPTTSEVFYFPNVTPDFGLTAPFNAWFTFFGQFFDHGLDLVTKGGYGTIFIPLQAG